MNKPLAYTLLFVGTVFLLLGLNAGNSLATEAVTGTRTETSLALMVTGIIAIVVGGSSSLSRRHY